MAALEMFDSEVKFTVLGFSVHILYLYSVLHIYFKSPILQGLPSVPVSHRAPAERLVLIIADGLQAEKAFHRKYASQTGFLRSVIMKKGSWGVSHSRAPTESRTGHVNIIAGTYEDVSAITNGWRINPVMFDSVINQSSTTWYWGHADIIRIFDQGLNNVESHCFDDIDFAHKDPAKMDTWVFDRVDEFFQQAQSSDKLKEMLHKDKLVFFLHLIGLDTNGHAVKPDSAQYIDNVRLVDEGIERINKIFESFYRNDRLTSFIFTSDHGMTPWGTHGSGMRSETETPFIGWGAGIQPSRYNQSISMDLPSTVSWGLEDYWRRDIQQVDLAPLMSYLIGIPIPVNSVGELPLAVVDGEYMDKASGMLENVRQIRTQYKAHEENVFNSAFTFKNYSDVVDFKDYDSLQKIVQMIEGKQFQNAIEQCKTYISHALNGIHYYQNYNRLYLSLVVNIGFVSWMILVLLKIVKGYTSFLPMKQTSRSGFFHSRLFSNIYYCSAVVFVLLLWYRSKSSAVIILSIFPMAIVKYVMNQLTLLNVSTTRVFNVVFIRYGLQLLLFIVGIEMMVLAFFDRRIISVLGVGLSFLPWMKRLSTTTMGSLSTKQTCVFVLWTVFCVIISIFPQLPVVTHEEKYILVVIGGFVGTTAGLVYSMFNKNANNNVISVTTALMLATLVVKMHSVTSIRNGDGLPVLNQMFSWLSLIVFPALSFLVDAESITRLVVSSMSFFSIYILMSISYEVLFLASLICLLTIWIIMEVSVWIPNAERLTSTSHTRTEKKKEHHLTSDHVRISFLFLFLIFVSFFGTGNIASVNSFDIASMYCFQTIFNKPLQGFILCCKVFIPVAIVTVFFRSLQSLVDLPVRTVFLMVLLMTDLMAINFFFLIRDEGSWVDIGESVSHFLITIVFTVVLFPIYHFSYFISGQVKLGTAKAHSS